jgi:hypothetical protein
MLVAGMKMAHFKVLFDCQIRQAFHEAHKASFSMKRPWESFARFTEFTESDQSLDHVVGSEFRRVLPIWPRDQLPDKVLPILHIWIRSTDGNQCKGENWGIQILRQLLAK